MFRGFFLPVIRDIEVEAADMRSVLGEDDVTSELARGEPEGKVWNIVELELCMNPAEENRTSSVMVCSGRRTPDKAPL